MPSGGNNKKIVCNNNCKGVKTCSCEGAKEYRRKKDRERRRKKYANVNEYYDARKLKLCGDDCKGVCKCDCIESKIYRTEQKNRARWEKGEHKPLKEYLKEYKKVFCNNNCKGTLCKCEGAYNYRREQKIIKARKKRIIETGLLFPTNDAYKNLKHYIYKITYMHYIYIGITSNFPRRARIHRLNTCKGIEANQQQVHKTLYKEGINTYKKWDDNVRIEVMSECINEDEARKNEDLLICKFSKYQKLECLNITN